MLSAACQFSRQSRLRQLSVCRLSAAVSCLVRTQFWRQENLPIMPLYSCSHNPLIRWGMMCGYSASGKTEKNTGNWIVQGKSKGKHKNFKESRGRWCTSAVHSSLLFLWRGLNWGCESLMCFDWLVVCYFAFFGLYVFHSQCYVKHFQKIYQLQIKSHYLK